MAQSDSLLTVREQDLEDIVLTQTAAGACLRGRYRSTGLNVAIRVLSAPAASESQSVDGLRDLALVRRVRSERVLVPLGLYKAHPLVCLVSEWMASGSLYSLLYETHMYPDFPAPLRIRILLDVAEGLSHLHGIPIPHTSLRPTNVLLDEQYRAKVSDYGWWRGQSSGFNFRGQHSPSIRDLMYLAPEVLRGELPSAEADMYSFGTMMLETFNRRLPYENAGERQARHLPGQIWTETCSMAPDHALSQLTIRCQGSDPRSRSSALDCMQVLRQALATYDPKAPTRIALQLHNCKERAVLGCKDQATSKIRVEINNLEFSGACRDPKRAYTKAVPFDLLQAPTLRTPSQVDVIPRRSLSPPSGRSCCPECASRPLRPTERLQSQSDQEFQKNKRTGRTQQRVAVSTLSSPPLSAHVRPQHSALQQRAASSQGTALWPSAGHTCCQLLRKRREVIVQGMTEGRLNNLLDVLRARQALTREAYELIMAAPTLAMRTRSLLDTCLCLGEGVATLASSTLGLISVATPPSPSHLSHQRK